MTHPDLSNKAGSLAFALTHNVGAINKMATDTTTPVAVLKATITELINGINSKEIKSPATQRFLSALNKQSNKTAIALLVYNTILAGDNLTVS